MNKQKLTKKEDLNKNNFEDEDHLNLSLELINLIEKTFFKNE